MLLFWEYKFLVLGWVSYWYLGPFIQKVVWIPVVPFFSTIFNDICYNIGYSLLEFVCTITLSPRRTQPSPSPRCNWRNYENSIESQLTDSLIVLGLEPGVTGREINVQYRFLARRLHPEKHGREITGMKSEEAVEQFKRVNNAQQFIRNSM